MQQRRSQSSAALQVQRPAKQTLSSSRGFGAVGRRSTTSILRQAVGLAAVPVSPDSQDFASPAEVGIPPPRPSVEVCAICLDQLDVNHYVYPCGHDHRIHYKCMISFTGSLLALPLADDSPGLLTREVARNMGFGFKAIRTLEVALQKAKPETINRVCCPLCRSPWPSQEAAALGALMDQLRAASAIGQAENALKMQEVLSRVWNHFDHGEDVQQMRKTKALMALEDNLHSASSFFAKQEAGNTMATCLATFLDARSVSRLSETTPICTHLYHVEAKLRTPHLVATKLRSAFYHASAPDVVTVSINAGMGSPSTRAINALEVVAFTKWLTGCKTLSELTMSCVNWEKHDPGASKLSSTLVAFPLRVLDLANNSMTDGSIKNVAEALMSSACNLKSLETLNLGLNYVTKEGLACLLPLASRKGSCIKEWCFRHNKLADASCQLIAQVLDPVFTKAPLCGWDLRTNNIGAAGCMSLLPYFGQVTVARLGCNPLGDIGVEHLSTGVGKNLRVLDLRHAQISDAGAIALGAKLGNALALEELLLAGNEIGVSGARALASGWSWVGTLRFVDLSSNTFGSDGVRSLCDSLPSWTQTPFRLSLAGVGCEAEGAREILSALRRAPRRGWDWRIDLQNNPLGNVGLIFELAGMLEGEREDTGIVDDEEDSEA